MLNEEPESFSPAVLIGIVGLLIVAWNGFFFVKSLGWFHAKSQSPVATASTQPTSTPAQVQARDEYAAIGNSGVAKTVSPAGASQGATIVQNVVATPLKLPYAAPPFNGAGWIYDWGAASIASGTLDFGAAASDGTSPATTGGDLFLANSNAWTNYSVVANVDWLAGQSFGIIARLTDGKNFVYCDFGDAMAQIVVRTDGDDAVVAHAATANAGPGTVENLGMDVYGDDVACTVDGVEVLGATISQGEPANGGIGLISWDQTPGVSRIAIEGLQAEALAANTITAPFPVLVPTPSTTPTSSVATTTSTVAAPASPSELSLPYFETDFANDKNWQGTWGVTTVDSSNFFDIGSAADTSGGSAVLLNTNNWMNYNFAATLDWVTGQTFMLLGRYVDTGDYVACNFVRDPKNSGGVVIELEKFVAGNEATLQTGEDTNFLHEGTTNIAVSLVAQGTTATCSFNNHAVSNTGSNSYGVNQEVGSIGFSTWDPTLDNTEIVVKQVSVASNY